ncbi:acyltransferase family protein, partial [Staphylococcus aureus]
MNYFSKATGAVAPNESSKGTLEVMRAHQMRYRSDIDGLRAIAVLLVVSFHAFPAAIKGGFVGVDIFFVISGFLIISILLNAQHLDLKDFYRRRILRIFPALSVVLGVCLVGGWALLLSGEFKQLGKHVVAGSAFFANLAFWSEAGYFDAAADTKPLLHLWSLGVEEQ